MKSLTISLPDDIYEYLSDTAAKQQLAMDYMISQAVEDSTRLAKEELEIASEHPEPMMTKFWMVGQPEEPAAVISGHVVMLLPGIKVDWSGSTLGTVDHTDVEFRPTLDGALWVTLNVWLVAPVSRASDVQAQGESPASTTRTEQGATRQDEARQPLAARRRLRQVTTTTHPDESTGLPADR